MANPRLQLVLPEKGIRALVIRSHVATVGHYRGVVCFTCGNAADALRRVGQQVLECGPRGDLVPTRWWTPAEIACSWPGWFDATPGHLPMQLMCEVADGLREHVRNTMGDLEVGTEYVVPTGSGETVCCLALAFPLVRFVARYDDTDIATTYHPQATLNTLVARLVRVEHAVRAGR